MLDFKTWLRIKNKLTTFFFEESKLRLEKEERTYKGDYTIKYKINFPQSFPVETVIELEFFYEKCFMDFLLSDIFSISSVS
jgi:hypothetical protein